MFLLMPALGWCPAVSVFEGLQAPASIPAVFSPASSALLGVRNWRLRPGLRSCTFRGATARLNVHRSRLSADRRRGQPSGRFHVRGFGIEDRSSGPDDNEEPGGAADGRDASASAKVFTPLYDANLVVNWPLLMKGSSKNVRGAVAQYVARKVGDLPTKDFQVMIQTDRAAIFMMMIKAMYEGFELRSAELRLEWQQKFELPPHPPRVKPEIILTQQDRDNASPTLQAWIQQVEERAVVTESDEQACDAQRKVRALDAISDKNDLVVFQLGLTSKDKAEFLNCMQRSFLDHVFSWNANRCLNSLDIHPIIASANVWYYALPEHGSSEGNTMTEATCCVKAGRDYIHTLIVWGMFLGIYARNLQLQHDRKYAQEKML